MNPFCEDCGTFHVPGACDLVRELREHAKMIGLDQLSFDAISAADGSRCAYLDGLGDDPCPADPAGTRVLRGVPVPACALHLDAGGFLNRYARSVWTARVAEREVVR